MAKKKNSTIDQLLAALKDAKSRGLTDIDIVLNSHGLQVPIDYISVSTLLGATIYVKGWDKNFIGYAKPNSAHTNQTN